MGQDSSKIKKLYEEAMHYEDIGDLQSALNTQIELFNLDSQSYPSANVIAGLYGKLGQFDNEVLWATKATTIKADYSAGYINLGNGYSGQGDLVKAEGSFNHALQLDSLNAIPYYSLGVLEEAKGDLKKAIAFYEKSVLVDATFQDGYYNLAAAYANSKEFKKANDNILILLKLNPNDKDAQEMHDHIMKEIK